MKAKEAEDWLKSKTWLSEQPTPPPRALIDLVDKMHRKALRLVRLPKPRLPAFADLGSLKAKVERQLEAACKAIVKKRDLKDGWGNCISCKKNSNRLQWGHFIPQHKSPWLRFDPRNTAMQCAECNGPGHGMTFEYGQALNARDSRIRILFRRPLQIRKMYARETPHRRETSIGPTRCRSLQSSRRRRRAFTVSRVCCGRLIPFPRCRRSRFALWLKPASRH